MVIDDISRAVEAVKIKLPALEYRLDEPMKDHTSIGIGGIVRSMFFPGNTEELVALKKLLLEYEAETLIIGSGTNMLVNDRKLNMIVIRTNKLRTITRGGENEIAAEAGAALSKLAEFALNNGLSGLEFAYGIPGSLGGAASMNAGAYGAEMKDVIHSTTAYSMEKGLYTVTDAEHGFTYRGSRFSDNSDIIISSVIRLRGGDRKNIRSKMDELCARRRESQPLDFPSAGSVFKRPKDGYAAPLIEKAGLKGFMVGGAQVSEKHSGFIVNRGGATFDDVVKVIEHVHETVFRQFGVDLEPEIKIIR